MNRLNISIITLAFSLLFVACKEEKPAPVMPATPAVLAEVVKKDINSYLSTVGTTTAFESVDVVPQVSGQIVSVNFKQGENVKAGQVLFSIDKRPYQAVVDSANAELQRTIAQLKIDTLDAQRNANLVKDGYVDKQTYDALVAKVDMDKASVAAAQASLKQAQINLDWCDIKSPIAGKIGLYNVNLGNVVNSQSVLTTIQNLNKLYVDFVVPSQYLKSALDIMAKNNNSLDIIVSYIEDNMRDKSRKTKATIVLNKMRYETGSAILRGELENSDFLFWPSQAVAVEVDFNPIKGATLVPEIAVQTGALGSFVYTAKSLGNGLFILEQCPIKVGQLYENKTLSEVSGLKDCDFVVTQVSELRLAAGPWVYRATDKGIPYGADAKPIADPQKMKEFIMSTAPILDQYRAAAMAQAQATASATK